jgi:hypothetical protein
MRPIVLSNVTVHACRAASPLKLKAYMSDLGPASLLLVSGSWFLAPGSLNGLSQAVGGGADRQAPSHVTHSLLLTHSLPHSLRHHNLSVNSKQSSIALDSTRLHDSLSLPPSLTPSLPHSLTHSLTHRVLDLT